MPSSIRLRPADRVVLDAFDGEGRPITISIAAQPDNRTHVRIWLDADGVRARIVKPPPSTTSRKDP